MTPESTRLIVEFIGAIVIASMTFYFTRSHYLRKRQDDLADKLIEKREKRIEEANAVVDNMAELSMLVSKQGLELTHLRNPDDYARRRSEIAERMESLSIKVACIFLIKDAKLSKYHNQFAATIAGESNKISQILVRLITEKEIINENEFTDNLKAFNKRCYVLHKAMKKRLDELSQDNFKMDSFPEKT
ncbi:MAG TPA: hypothetical protein VFQ23_20465 [Anaerolineales bacterium]|nr:hypothetical protein [Anaerolineales bacterium]